ncbi:hypothetical protein GBA52_016624 [Prunus armeniaca]|nr:hypothetical protein GBA52_016624 [Prunus armeniaca]
MAKRERFTLCTWEIGLREAFSVASTHHSILQRALGSTLSAKESLIYSYRKSFNGFAARLSNEEVAKLSGASSEFAGNCVPNTLSSDKIKGKIVYCDSFSDGSDIRRAGGMGTIMVDFPTDVAFNYPLPSTQITIEDGQKILNYIRSTENPIATILVSDPEHDKDVMAPSIASFSSRGPNPLTPDILKLKNTQPVLPTTTVLDSKKHADLEFAYGSGQINPLKAVKPGLIFDTSEADYINFLCKQGYNNTTLRIITGDKNSSCGSTKPGKAWDLNYPSFSLQLEDGQEIKAEFKRTVTNVGSPNSNYTIASFSPHSTITVSVSPSTLSFSSVGERKSFTVKVTGPKISQQPIIYGSIVLNDGVHQVRAPLVVYTFLPGSIHISSSASQNKKRFKGSSLYHRNGMLRHT